MIARHHVEKWRAAGADVVAIADVEPRALDAFTQTHRIAGAYTDHMDLLRQEEGVEIVDICTPPWLHAPMAIAALEEGKHVLCEKPMAVECLGGGYDGRGSQGGG